VHVVSCVFAFLGCVCTYNTVQYVPEGNQRHWAKPPQQKKNDKARVPESRVALVCGTGDVLLIIAMCRFCLSPGPVELEAKSPKTTWTGPLKKPQMGP
jgi:uncharacterized membrane protein